MGLNLLGILKFQFPNGPDIKKVTRGLVQIPMVGGTIAFGYNYDCDLKLTQEQAVQVAMGMIKIGRN